MGTDPDLRPCGPHLPPSLPSKPPGTPLPLQVLIASLHPQWKMPMGSSQAPAFLESATPSQKFDLCFGHCCHKPHEPSGLTDSRAQGWPLTSLDSPVSQSWSGRSNDQSPLCAHQQSGQPSLWTVPAKVPGLSLPLGLPSRSHLTFGLFEVLRPPNSEVNTR